MNTSRPRKPSLHDPDQHPFTPYAEGSTACKWCPFHRKAHKTEAAFGAKLPLQQKLIKEENK